MTTETERLLWWIGLICAVGLLFAFLTTRTSWIGERGQGMRHSAGWDWVAMFAGMVTLTSLCVGASARDRRVLPGICAAVAAIAFGASGAAALGHWISLRYGELEMAGWTLYPAPDVLRFAVIGFVGMVATLVLLGRWLHPSDEYVPPGPNVTS